MSRREDETLRSSEEGRPWWAWRGRPLERGLAAGFVLLAWFVAAYYLWGRWGKWSDDYAIICSSPVTGEYAFSDIVRSMWQGMWRPVNLQVSGFLQTMLLGHEWAIHAITGGLHGLSAWMLYRFLRTVCRAPQAAAAAAMLFLAAPMGYEAVYWVSTIGTPIGVAMALGVCGLVVGLARGRIGWMKFVLAGVPLGFLVACAYEQPATACAAMPLLYLGVCPREMPWRSRLVNAALVGAALGAACVLYLVLFVETVPAGKRGSEGTFIGAATIVEQFRYTLHGINRRILLDQFAMGAIREGAWRFGQMPAQTLVVAGLAAVSGGAWLSWFMTDPVRLVGGAWSDDAAKKTIVRRGWILAFGVAIFLLSWLPILAIRGQAVESRLVYHPLVGCAVALAAMIDLIMERLSAARMGRGAGWAFRSALGVVVIGGVVTGCIMLVGVQSAMQKRWRMDQRGLARLVELVPRPARGTVFAAAVARDRAAHTGSFLFDAFATGVWHLAWTPTPELHIQYRREDVFGIPCADWTAGMDVDGATERGLIGKPDRWLGVVPLDAGRRRRVPWELIVPVRIGSFGRLEVADEVVLELPDGRDVRRRIKQVADALSARRAAGDAEAEGISIRIGCDDLDEDVRGMALVNGWTWPGGKAVEFARTASWDVTHAATRLEPRIEGDVDRSRMMVKMDAAEESRTLHMRATLRQGGRWRMGKALASEQGVIEVFVGGAAEPVARVTLNSKILEKERRWVDVACVIPASKSGVSVEVRVSASAGEAAANVWVTAGALVDEPAAK